MGILDQLKAGIDSLFNKINCDRAATGVSDSNMLQYLGIIEQRTNELLAIQTYVNTKDENKYDPKAPGLLGEGPGAPQQQFPVLPPAVGDEYESEGSEGEEDEARPFTRNELQAKVLKTVEKRETAAKKEGFKYDLSTRETKKDKKGGKK